MQESPPSGEQPKFEFRRVAIAGTGLIGASFGLAIRKAGFTGEILGVSSPPAIEAALARGAIDRGASLEEAASASDLIYLAQPISRILKTLPRLNEWVRPGTLVTDAGSTKSAIVAAAGSLSGAQFLGGHPLAGKEKSGAAQADPDLFADRTYVVTPLSGAELDTPPAREFVRWIERIGARLTILDPGRHDFIVAFTSHLAQLASTALAQTVGEALDTPGELVISGPGLADTTRLALSPYDVWRDILDTNAGAIEQALSAYINALNHLRRNLRSSDVERAFADAARVAQILPRRTR